LVANPLLRKGELKEEELLHDVNCEFTSFGLISFMELFANSGSIGGNLLPSGSPKLSKSCINPKGF
jgi:hypothetical protein